MLLATSLPQVRPPVQPSRGLLPTEHATNRQPTLSTFLCVPRAVGQEPGYPADDDEWAAIPIPITAAPRQAKPPKAPGGEGLACQHSCRRAGQARRVPTDFNLCAAQGQVPGQKLKQRRGATPAAPAAGPAVLELGLLQASLRQHSKCHVPSSDRHGLHAPASPHRRACLLQAPLTRSSWRPT